MVPRGSVEGVASCESGADANSVYQNATHATLQPAGAGTCGIFDFDRGLLPQSSVTSYSIAA